MTVHWTPSDPFKLCYEEENKFCLQFIDAQYTFSKQYALKQTRTYYYDKGKVVPVLNYGIWGSGCIDPHFLDLGINWEWFQAQ
jgi:hypothetical protein